MLKIKTLSLIYKKNLNYHKQMKAERTSKPKPVQSSPYDNNAKLATGERTRPSNYQNRK